jgi:catechol 2,3-dioxygenase
MNIWHSRNAPPVPADAVGLREFTIIVPDADSQDQIVARLETAGVVYQRQDSAVLFDDPWRNRIRLVIENAS